VQLTQLAERLSTRQWAVIDDVQRLGIVSGGQLRRLHYDATESAQRVARKQLGRLVELRILARLTRRIGGVRAGSEGFVYRLDVLGQRLMQPGQARYRRPWTPGDGYLGHALAVAELYVQLATCPADWKLLGYAAEPECWRDFNGPGGQPLVLKPDALVVGSSDDYEDRYFIEVDRGTEALPQVARKTRLYVSYWQSGREQAAEGIFPRVLWIAPTERRAQHIIDTIARLDAESWQLFAVTTSERACSFIVHVGSAPAGGSRP
jgi:hypothetical protein